jgi:amino acid transporter
MMEKMYADFTTKLLPTIQEGLVITKDYFFDLFGRYVKYLIITDIIVICFLVVALIAGIFLLRKSIKEPKTGRKWMSGDQDWGAQKTIYMLLALACLGSSIVIPFKVNSLIKAFYVPEIRIYQEIQWMRTIK